MALKDAVTVLVALALPIWLVAEQMVSSASSRKSEAAPGSAGASVESPAKKGTMMTQERPTFPRLPRKAA